MIAQHPKPCTHKGQDDIHGQGFRVMNPVRAAGKIIGWSCSVCSPPKEYGKKRSGYWTPDQLKVKA
jgi:hypothetical protein